MASHLLRSVLLAGAAALVLLVAVPFDHGAPGVSASGCFPGLPHAPGSFDASIATSIQGTRYYRLHVPPSYTGADRVPLVFGFHGFGSSALEQEFYSGLSVWSDLPDQGFIAVYPEGTPNVSGNQYWNMTAAPTAPDDVSFVDDLLDELENTLCIDTNRIFSSGMSNGAMMSVRLACSLSTRIAAIAPVAGAYYPPLFTQNPGETCPDTQPVPMIAFHGTADAIVPYNGGASPLGGTYRLAIDNATPDDDVLQAWAAHNGCTTGRSETTLTDEVRFIEYTSCSGGADALHYAVDGGGHTWPGSFDVPGLGYTTHDIDATQLMLEFFELHPLESKPPVDTDGDTIPDEDDPDNDNDGCPDANEASLDPFSGGMRDSKNLYDYFNPTGDGVNRVDDVLTVVQQYFEDEFLPPPAPPGTANPNYTPDTDRTALGPNPWNLGPPDGLQRVDDVLAIVNHYFHDCA